MAKMKSVEKNKIINDKNSKRSYLSQSDVPSFSLAQALRIPQAISDHYAGKDATPLQIAKALNVSPSSGPFRQLCGASIAYGLTEGGYNANHVVLSALGRRIFKPLREGDDSVAKREAILKPRIIRDFLLKYDGSAVPRADIAKNILEDMGVPEDKIESVYELILDSARNEGFLKQIKDKEYVDLQGIDVPFKNEATAEDTEPLVDNGDEEIAKSSKEIGQNSDTHSIKENKRSDKRVFISHGKNKNFVTQLKEIITFGKFIPVVAQEHETTSIPVPDKVLADMRTCFAGIIHIENEETLLDNAGVEHHKINENVLIEIGAAMALYNRNFILLVQKGIHLPSNLQGLYRCEYEGEKLDYEATMKLLKIFNEFITE